MAAASAINPAMAIAGAAQPLFQGILGITQGARARKMSQAYPRPNYMIPGAATNALYDQRNMAYGQAPGIGIAQQQLAQSQAGSAANIMNSGGGNNETLAALTMLDQNAGDQGLDLAAMQENWKAQQMGNYINQQNAYAQWQEKKRDWEVMQPYIQAQEKAAAMNDAANTNLHDALGVGGGLVAQSLVNKDAPETIGAASKAGMAGSGLASGIGAALAGKAANPAAPVVNAPFNPAKVTGQGEGPVLDNMLDNPISGDKPMAAVTPSLMPDLGTRGRRRSYGSNAKYMPELDNMGQLNRAK